MQITKGQFVVNIISIIDHHHICFRYAIVFQKGYQDFDAVTGAVTTKVKGVAKTYNLTGQSERVWDVSDYVVPSQVVYFLVIFSICFFFQNL